MKIQVVKLDEVLDIICDYYNQMGETFSLNAKEYLEEQINMCSFEVELKDKLSEK